VSRTIRLRERFDREPRGAHLALLAGLARGRLPPDLATAGVFQHNPRHCPRTAARRFMGRETKLLLGLLGLLAGVFVGVLSMKLFVPRPPAGAGPDIHTEVAAGEPHTLVEPPSFTMPASAFAAAPPLVPVALAGQASADQASAAWPPPDAGDRHAATADGGSDALPPVAGAAEEPALPTRDPFVTNASFEEPAAAVDIPSPAAATAAEPWPHLPPAAAAGPVTPAPTATAVAGGHVVQAGDTWWSLAERAYGDGRLYRALFAWNRVLNPRVTLAPGTSLELPPLADLSAAWPHLLPPTR
jgi:LysM repeat protein